MAEGVALMRALALTLLAAFLAHVAHAGTKVINVELGVSTLEQVRKTASSSGKALREEPVIEGRARLITDGAEYEAVRAATQAKYGVAMKVAEVADWAWELGGKGTPVGVVIVSIVG